MSSLYPINSVTDYNILDPEHEDFDAVRRLDQFKIANVEYVRSDSLASLKEPRAEVSSIWRFGEKEAGGEAQQTRQRRKEICSYPIPAA
jgi:hypothetical protein